MEIERTLATGRGDEYRAVLADDALVVVPGSVLTKGECIDAMDASPGWTEVELGEPRLVESPSTVTVVYTFTGTRAGEPPYTAILASTYVRADGWRLLLHQHTPLPAPSD